MTLNSQDFAFRHKMEEFANGRASRGFFEMIDPRHLSDEQFINISDGTTDFNFTVDKDGGGVSGGTAIDVSAVADGDEDALADVYVAAITAAVFNVSPTKVVDPGGSGKVKIELLNDAAGANDVALTQGIQGGSLQPAVKFPTTGLAGGSTAITSTDIIRITKDDNRWILFWTTP